VTGDGRRPSREMVDITRKGRIMRTRRMQNNGDVADDNLLCRARQGP
jgi:hypothetical protein